MEAGAQDAPMSKIKNKSERFNNKGLKKREAILATRFWIAGTDRNLLRSGLLRTNTDRSLAVPF